jgi:hypothetical protein
VHHQEVFRSIGADHRLGYGNQPDLLALQDRSRGGGFERIAKQPVEFMDDDEIKRALFADSVREQFF